VYAEIFERELSSWDSDDSNWPKPRTFALFLEWFEVHSHSIVEDLGRDELGNDEE
jgi:hypothetical protein